MKRHLLPIFVISLLGILFSTEGDVFSHNQISDEETSFVFDKTQSDIESYFDMANSSETPLPDLQNSTLSPSFRLLSSQKKTQQNTLNVITFLKRFSSEVIPTKNYNTKFSYPLATKDDLIVIIKKFVI